MNGLGGFFRNLSARIAQAVGRFMQGRYGSDKLNTVILMSGLIISLLQLPFREPVVRLILMAISYGLMLWAVFRMLSRNTYKRYRENRKFLQLLERVKDREHKYYECPRCHQTVRVPKGKGKISITCPKCKEKFVKKT